MRCRHCGRPIPDDARNAPYCCPSHRRADGQISPIARAESAVAKVRAMTPEEGTRAMADFGARIAALPYDEEENEGALPKTEPPPIGRVRRDFLARLAEGLIKN